MKKTICYVVPFALFCLSLVPSASSGQGSVIWATYYGSTDEDDSEGITTDPWGNVFLAGTTTSGSGIATAGAYQTFLATNPFPPSYDAFLAKFGTGGNLLWCTYFGGTNNENAYATASDINGNVYMSGYTTSSSGVASAGAFKTSYSGGVDAFLVKFNSAGTFQWSTYYGGTGDDRGYGLSTDASGNAYLAGTCASAANIASGGFQTTYGGASDAYLVKFTSAGARVWATYYGGSGFEYGYCTAIEPASGNVYLAGETGSAAGIATAGAYKTTNSGGGDAFVVKFDPSGGRLWGTYYGGTSSEEAFGIATDATLSLYMGGSTASSTGIASPSGFKTNYGGVADAYLVKFDASGVRQWATYYGQSDPEEMIRTCVATDPASGNVFLVGDTYNASTGNPSGMAYLGYQLNLNGYENEFMVTFDPNGNRNCATYYGFNEEEAGKVAMDGNGNVYMVGHTSSPGMATPGGFQTDFAGGPSDAYVVKFAACIVLPVELVSFRARQTIPSEILTSWVTASETNNDYFILERSTDGVYFEPVAKIKGAGNSTTERKYEFTDHVPAVNTKQQTLYYRLKQYDYNDNYTYSRVISMSNKARSRAVNVYPNPSGGDISCEFYSSLTTPATITVRDIFGNIMQQKKILKPSKGLNTIPLEVTSLSGGMYFIQVDYDLSQVQLVKFVKQ